MIMGALFSRIRTFLPLALGPHRLHPNAAAALGAPAKRELTLTPRGGFACPPRAVAAGAFALAPGPFSLRSLCE